MLQMLMAAFRYVPTSGQHSVSSSRAATLEAYRSKMLQMLMAALRYVPLPSWAVLNMVTKGCTLGILMHCI